MLSDFARNILERILDIRILRGYFMLNRLAEQIQNQAFP